MQTQKDGDSIERLKVTLFAGDVENDRIVWPTSVDHLD